MNYYHDTPGCQEVVPRKERSLRGMTRDSLRLCALKVTLSRRAQPTRGEGEISHQDA